MPTQNLISSPMENLNGIKKSNMGICWCGNSPLDPFSPAYNKCVKCGTLVLATMPDEAYLRVNDDQKDFYGRRYYETHLMDQYNYPSLKERARADLPERCLHWLCTFLKYRLPPARLLELGSAHGGLIALLRFANFEATGLELSDRVADFARQTFHVPMLLGPVEEQDIEVGSLDGIFLMDVLEHLQDPMMTMNRCFNLCKADGIFLIQTPEYPEYKTFEEMVSQNDLFLDQLKAKEHLFLFSRRSIHEFFHRLGANHVIFETAIFSHYDMFLVVSRSPISETSIEEMEKRLAVTPQGRLVQAMIDLKSHIGKLQNLLQVCEADRSARLQVIQNLEQSLSWRMTVPLRWARAKWNVIFRQE
jgi:SAM-dependent methyltransferase